MARITLNDVCVSFPVFSWHGRSIKHQIAKYAVGGTIRSNKNHSSSVDALVNITLDIRNGDRVAIMGHNGSGKTTLLRTLSKIYYPTHGEIKVYGTIHSLIDIMLGVDFEATGRENIYLRGLLMGLKKSEINQYEEEIIEFSELNDFIDLPIRTYSSGMAIRLAFAISTVVRSDILIMDEWLTVGDEGFIKKAEEKLLQIINSTKILIIATHDVSLVKKICNRLVLIEHGKIQSDQVMINP